MTPKQFVAEQLRRPKKARVIPDRIYMWDNRTGDIYRLREGHRPFNAGDGFISSILYENAAYFKGTGRHKYYPNGVFSI